VLKGLTAALAALLVMSMVSAHPAQAAAGAAPSAFSTRLGVALGSAAPAACDTSMTTSFDTPASTGSIASPGEVDCFALSSLSAGDRVEIDLAVTAGNVRWKLLDGTGAIICSGSSATECTITGAPAWQLTIADASTATFAYTVAVHRLTNPQGCTSLGAPDEWSFTAPRINGTIDTPLQTRCYTFTRAVGEADGDYWIRTARTAGAISPK
jgi:hypothetical protein